MNVIKSYALKSVLAILFLFGLGEASYAAPTSKDAQQVFSRFVEAQNNHDVSTVAAMLWDSPDFLWVSRGIPVRGALAALTTYREYYKGTWHLDPDMTHFSAAILSDNTMQVLVPITFTRGALGQIPQVATYLISQTFILEADGWHVASVLPLADTHLK